jgi:hypothetical protein
MPFVFSPLFLHPIPARMIPEASIALAPNLRESCGPEETSPKEKTGSHGAACGHNQTAKSFSADCAPEFLPIFP